ncbi:hypothetical protein MUG78_17450 [Gordonia alkaliphila]|uniref:hypothetical protein n=1 Tax=Gordonia alkaliphila TaxID=1053547 RepID=UPI001FF1394F|nr:hypothetical protein [Gordonia alkaliphila]MCK0441187.1 hypothetical protein [Gordonia alkaliphila]
MAVRKPSEGAVADNHALLVTDFGLWTPSGRRLYDKPIESVDQLLRALLWRRHDLRAAKVPPQAWILAGACEQLGWGPDAVDPGEEDDPIEEVIGRLDAVTDELFAPLLAEDDDDDGWHLFRPAGESGWRIHLLHTANGGRDRFLIDLFLEGWASLTSRDRFNILGSKAHGTVFDFDNDRDGARELGRRLVWHLDNLKVLPGNTPARTGAAMADRIWDTRKKNAKTTKARSGTKAPGAFPVKATPLPPVDDDFVEDIEPVGTWSRAVGTDEFVVGPRAGGEEVIRLVTIDQRASYLASAGMVSLGLGELQHLAGDDAAAQLSESATLPFGLWRVTLPAAASLGLPPLLPLPHPRMAIDRDTQMWVTTESVKSLTAPIASGGAGLDWLDLGVTEAWLTDQQGLALKTWKEDLAAARTSAIDAGDPAMKAMVGDIYKGYLGRMANPELWQGRLAHHHQPLWRASIIAHARHRSRAKATAVAADHQIWPIKSVTDSWTYLVPGNVEVADDAPGPDGTVGRAGRYLGKFTTESDVVLDDERLLALLNTTTAAEVTQAVDAIERAAKNPTHPGTGA